MLGHQVEKYQVSQALGFVQSKCASLGKATDAKSSSFCVCVQQSWTTYMTWVAQAGAGRCTKRTLVLFSLKTQAELVPGDAS